MTKNKGGRPKKQIDKKLFENLCSIQCTKDEMCGILECHEETLTRWCHDTYGMGFSDIYKRKSVKGKASLRRMQFKSAEKGNVAMLIWLGKQYLGQKDKVEETTDAGSEVADALRGLLGNGTNEKAE